MKTTLKIAGFGIALILFGFALDERYKAGVMDGAEAIASECVQYREAQVAGVVFACAPRYINNGRRMCI